MPVVGAPDLEPSGTGPCVLTPRGSQNVSIHHAPGNTTLVIAMLGAGLGEIPFEFRDGWFGIDAGNGQTGWIAPDEGRLVGC